MGTYLSVCELQLCASVLDGVSGGECIYHLVQLV